jgi:hypothetical protein
MNQNKNHTHSLLIKPILKSKSKRYYHIFKPKEIVVAQPYELSLYVRNLGDLKFPGGVVDSFSIEEGHQGIGEIKLEIKIPPLDKKESVTTNAVQCNAFGEGVAWIRLKIKSKDNGIIEYCQFDRATNKSTIIGTDGWHDYFHISSLQEIRQQFTNYLLLFLTVVMILLICIQILIPYLIDKIF